MATLGPDVRGTRISVEVERMNVSREDNILLRVEGRLWKAGVEVRNLLPATLFSPRMFRHRPCPQFRLPTGLESALRLTAGEVL